MTDIDTLFRVKRQKEAQDRYDELAERIHLYYHLDATIESDVAEFGELRKVLGKDQAA